MASLRLNWIVMDTFSLHLTREGRLKE
jgi:hypothetical protein